MFNNQIIAGSSGQGGEVQQSLKFNDDESQYLSWTPAAASNRKTWTFSAWVKLGSLTQGERGTIFQSNYGGPTIYQDSGLRFAHAWDPAGTDYIRETVAVFRDPSAWYHVVWWCDTTQAGTRWKIYVNGVEQSLQTPSGNNGEPAQNTDLNINSTNNHTIGNFADFSFFDGYLAEVNFIDGQALDASSFGETVDGYWKAKDYSGTYGTNGFHLTFADDVVSEGFNTVTYTGNGSTQSVSGLGLSPDFVWIKSRSSTDWHAIHDSVRGATKRLSSNVTDAEATDPNFLSSFDNDGFSLGLSGSVNGSGKQYVAWAWDAGSGSAVSNTDGTITSTVKANPSYGFSVASWTGNSTAGATIGHGLTSAPEMVIVKNRTDAENWSVFHTSVGNTKSMTLNSTDAALTSTNYWNDTSPSASVVTLGSDNSTNGSSDNMVAYCFAEISGYSSIGSYSGTGAAGNVVTTGFRPAFLLYKRTDAAANDWVIMDTTRSPSNPVEKRLFPNLSDAESAGAGGGIDVTDTGFVINNTYANANASGGTYIYMAFADTREAAFWKDVSGQGNHWTPNNLDYRDSLPDSPANNFCTGNSLKSYNGGGGSPMVYSEGNLKLSRPSGATGWASSYGSMSVSSGKWFWEAMCFHGGSADNVIGVHEANTSMFQIVGYSGDPTGYGYSKGGNKLNNSTGSAYGATYANGDVIGVALDMDAGTVAFYKNGASQGTAFTGLSGDFIAAFSSTNSSSDEGFWIANFGQDSTFAGAKPMGAYTDDSELGTFQYQPPVGFKSLCSQNLPIPTIIDGSEYFNTLLWTGDGSNPRTLSGLDFSADFIWHKSRSAASMDHHAIQDVVRGFDANNNLYTSLTGSETAYPNRGVINSVSSTGFTFNQNASDYSTADGLNQSGRTFVAWNWKAGGTAVSNTDGSITSQVSANTAAGFSIVTYTHDGTNASTVGHGLGVTPSFIINKQRNAASNWRCYHKSLPAGYNIQLNLTQAQSIAGDIFQTGPTSSVFTPGNGDSASGKTFVSYVFANVEGFSKVGSYTGNGSTSNPPFVFTGFRPAWVLIKCSSASSTNWLLLDNKREGYNSAQDVLFPESNAAEETNAAKTVDFLSNGFKVAATANGSTNASGGTYIFLAFAENPFKYANAR